LEQPQNAASVTKNIAEMLESEDNETVLEDLGIAKMLRCRVAISRMGR